VIPALLWRCPLCHVDDALRHKTHWFKPDQVWCTQCGTVWEVRRVIGDDYRLKVLHGEPTTIAQERPLAEWYDLMKAKVTLANQDASALNLEAGEVLYVQSQHARLLVEEDNPLRSLWEKEEAPWQKEGDLGLSFMKKWDTGRLFLTNERLIWQGDRRVLTFWLRKVNSVHTEVTWYFGLLYGLCLYKFQFRQESILKWLTYTAMAAQRIEQVYQHKIALSNY
jgi:hypothetical protein